ncbi:putrescine hydroxycinnamoyltransferase 2-like [Carex rostrata]
MVEVHESTFVIPSEEAPRGKLWLSSIDQVAPPAYTYIVALANTLVHLYPLAGGSLIGEGYRSRVVDCNGEGAFFVVVRLDRSTNDINFQLSLELRSLSFNVRHRHLLC